MPYQPRKRGHLLREIERKSRRPKRPIYVKIEEAMLTVGEALRAVAYPLKRNLRKVLDTIERML